MNKQIKGSLLIALLAISSIAQAEQNTITSLAKAVAVGFSLGFGAIVVPDPAVSVAVPVMILDNAYTQEHYPSKLESTALSGSAIAGAIAAIGAWYKTGQCITNTLWGTDIGRYIAIIPAANAALMAWLAYCLKDLARFCVEIGALRSPQSSHSYNVSSSESITERA